MSAPRKRGWTQKMVATRLGISEQRFCQLKVALYTEGFPMPDSITGRTDGKAVNHWMDVRSRLVDWNKDTSDADPYSERVRGMGHGHA